MVEIYNTRLTERERRGAFVMDRKLINVRKQQNLDRRRNPAEREMYARLKAVARYLPQQEFEVLSDGVVTETRLRARIQVLPQICVLCICYRSTAGPLHEMDVSFPTCVLCFSAAAVAKTVLRAHIQVLSCCSCQTDSAQGMHVCAFLSAVKGATAACCYLQFKHL